MNRSLKKTIYGVLYAAIVVLILWQVIGISLEKSASCFDNRQNQGETEVDCGGPCLPCAAKTLDSLRVSIPQLFSLSSGRTVLLAEIANPNPDFGVPNFAYTIKIYNLEGQVVQEIFGKESIYASEKKYIYSAEIQPLLETIGRGEIVLGELNFRPAAEFLRPKLTLQGEAKTEAAAGAIRVRGVIANQNSLEAENIWVIGVLFDGFGEPIFASRTFLSRLGGLAEAPFIIIFPRDEAFLRRVEPSKTQVFVSSR